MRIVSAIVAFLLVLVFLSPEATATPGDPPDAALLSGEEILLWPGDAPGSEGLLLQETITERSDDPNRHDRAFTGTAPRNLLSS